MLSSVCVFAQNQEARKIDEYNAVSPEEFYRRLDVLAFEVMKNPNSKGYIVVYTGKFIKHKPAGRDNLWLNKETVLPRLGQSNSNLECIMKHLSGQRNMPKERLLFISGGYRELYMIELRLVPNGIAFKPSPTLTEMKYRKGKPVDICSEI